MKKIITFFIPAVILLILMNSSLSFGIKSISPNDYIPDLQILKIYSAKDLMDMLKQMGADGRNNYLVMHQLDYFFIFFFAGFLLSSITYLYKVGLWRSILTISALFFAGMDYAEDLWIDFKIIPSYPYVADSIAGVPGYFTFFKYCSILISVVGILIGAISRIKEKNTRQ